VVAGWYIFRERLSPGYWEAVNLNELGGRFGTTLENHLHPWYYYIGRMMKSKFLPWVYVLPLAIPFALRHPNARARRVAWFALSWAAGLLLVLSLAKTKIEWYAVPAYPWLAIVLALGAPRLATWVLSKAPAGAPRLALRVLLAAFLVVPPFITIRHELRGNWRDNFEDVRAGYGLRELQREANPPAPLTVIGPAGFYRSLKPHSAVGGVPGYNAHLRFYVLAYPRDVRVMPARAIGNLRGPGYVLTTSAIDSARLRAVFPQLPHRAVGRYACWLWTLPTN
jgi:hypothetical protein